MRIEKVNENQIRCFLSKEEMDRRQLHLKELAYGTDKAKALFRELMQEAFSRYGFQADNMPVMIEAVPLFDDSLVIIVTKVDNPEELDTRFSSFAPLVKNSAADADMPMSSTLGQLLDTIRQGLGINTPGEEGTGSDAKAAHNAEDASGRAEKAPSPGIAGKGAGRDPAGKSSLSGAPGKSAFPGASNKDAFPAAGRQLFTFPTLGKACDAAGNACGTSAGNFEGSSALYRDPADSKYYLFVSPGENAPAADTSRMLSTLSEFGTCAYITPAREQYLLEHCEVLCAQGALQKLAELSHSQ